MSEMAVFPIISAWLQFAVCTLLIGYAGVKLSRYGDIIAEKTGMGGTWAGLVLLATVTSLPELITGVSSVTIAHAPNIAIGDALGSCVFNLLLIVILDYLHRGESVYRRAHQGHILSAGFGIILIGFVAFNLLLGNKGDGLSFGHVGLYTPIILLFYLLAMRVVFRYQKEQMAAHASGTAEQYPGVTLTQATRGYVLAALVVVAAGLWLPFIGSTLAEVMGWHKTFVGTLFIAFTTSVPELVVTVSALRIGALDMAIANLLGSNLFDIAIIAVDDLFYSKGPILSQVSPLHAMSAVSAIIMTGTAIVGLIYRPAGKVLKTVGWASMFLFSVYLVNAYVLYLYGE